MEPNSRHERVERTEEGRAKAHYVNCVRCAQSHHRQLQVGGYWTYTECQWRAAITRYLDEHAKLDRILQIYGPAGLTEPNVILEKPKISWMGQAVLYLDWSIVAYSAYRGYKATSDCPPKVGSESMIMRNHARREDVERGLAELRDDPRIRMLVVTLGDNGVLYLWKKWHDRHLGVCVQNPAGGPPSGSIEAVMIGDLRRFAEMGRDEK